MPNGLTIQPNGQTLIVTAIGSNVFYTDTGLSAAVTLPALVTADTTWYCSAANAGHNTFTVTQADGTVLMNAQSLFVGQTTDTFIRPAPTASQMAADTGVLDYFDTHGISGAEETMPRQLAATAVTMTSGDLKLSYFTARKTIKVASISVATGGTGAGATPTTIKLGIYSVAANGDLTLQASSANDTALFSGTQTVYNKALSASYTITAGSRYAVGIIVVTGAAAPTLMGIAPSFGLAGLAPKFAGYRASRTDLDASITAAQSAQTANQIYAALLTT